MSVKRIITEDQRQKLAIINLKEHKGKNPDTLTQDEINDLVKKISQKLGLL